MTTNWVEEHIYEALDLGGRRLARSLLYGCKLENLRGTLLAHCCLAESQIAPRTIEDMVGFTVTLDCFSWKDVQLNELALDLMLYLLTLGKGNDEKRAMLKRMIRPEHLLELESDFERLQRAL
jgi:hypothetical protein